MTRSADDDVTNVDLDLILCDRLQNQNELQVAAVNCIMGDIIPHQATKSVRFCLYFWSILFTFLSTLFTFLHHLFIWIPVVPFSTPQFFPVAFFSKTIVLKSEAVPTVHKLLVLIFLFCKRMM